MIFRVEKTKGFTVMSNYHLFDRRLSFKARGVLSVVLALPEGWNYSVAGLTTLSDEDGKASVGTALKELERLKYLKREQSLNGKGQFSGFEYVFYEFPQEPFTENRFTEKPFTENPFTENRTQSNTNKVITNKQSTNILSTDVDAGDQESHPGELGEQQQQPAKYIFVGKHVNVCVEVSWYERFKATYPYYRLVENELSQYKEKNGITAHINDMYYLDDWAQTDKERFEYQFSLQNTASFDANDFFDAALNRSYGRKDGTV